MVARPADAGDASERHKVGDNLRRVRELNGLSQRELARRAGVPNSSVSMIEQGRVSPSIDTLGRLLDAIPISFEHFFRCDPSAESSFFFRVALTSGPVTDLPVDPVTDWLEQILSPRGMEAKLEIAQQSFLPFADTGTQSLNRGSCCSGLVISGSLEVTVGARVQVLEPGDGYYLADQSLYRLRNTRDDAALVFLARSFTAV